MQHLIHNTIQYNLTTPNDFDPARKYPLIIYLHGAGGRGHDLELPRYPYMMEEYIHKNNIPVPDRIGKLFENGNIPIQDPGTGHCIITDPDGKKFTGIHGILHTGVIVVKILTGAFSVFFINGNGTHTIGFPCFGTGFVQTDGTGLGTAGKKIFLLQRT